MKIELCKKALQRLGEAGAAALVSELREREHTPALKECLNRCQACERGLLVASAGGYPIGAPDATKLLADVDAIAANEDA